MFDKTSRYGRKIEKIDNKIQYWRDLYASGQVFIFNSDKASKKISKLEYKERKYQNKLKRYNAVIFKH